MEKHMEKQTALDQFKALYISYAPALIRYASQFVGINTAEDLAQDIFMKVWLKHHSILKDESELKNYLYQSIRNACLDHLRHKDIEHCFFKEAANKFKTHISALHSENDLIFLQKQQLSRIYQEIGKLPEKRKQIFLMSYQDERKNIEIAKILKISQRTVEAQLYKALKTLRAAILMSLIFLSFFPL